MSIHESLQGHPWVVQVEILDREGNPHWSAMKHSGGDIYTYATEELALQDGRRWYPEHKTRARRVEEATSE